MSADEAEAGEKLFVEGEYYCNTCDTLACHDDMLCTECWDRLIAENDALRAELVAAARKVLGFFAGGIYRQEHTRALRELERLVGE